MTEQTGSKMKEDQLVAAISHAGVLIPTFGLIIPIIVWITQKERSAYLKKQALQAALWQGLALLVQFLTMGCYFLSIFLLIPFSILAEGSGNNIEPAAGGLLTLIFILLFILGIILYMGGGLIHFGFAIAGIVQSLRGVDFNYPFIGRWVNKRFITETEIHTLQEDADQT